VEPGLNPDNHSLSSEKGKCMLFRKKISHPVQGDKGEEVLVGLEGPHTK